MRLLVQSSAGAISYSTLAFELVPDKSFERSQIKFLL
jgi:hypothetical protein